ncbi:MAG: histidinol-phosphatase [Bacteroidales bacterium]|nr:histidinol-phosphatase [Bacteroidales bacterium]
MHFYNFHTHSAYDDGKKPPEEYVLEAIRLGIKSLGFSGHSPLPFQNEWCIKEDELKKYLNEIHFLKNKYKNEIEIYSGLEVDYIEDVSSPIETLKKHKLDFVIGSIHFIKNKGQIFEIDGKFENFEKGFVTYFDSEAKPLVESYTACSLEMIKNHNPDILGHFDKIKLYLSRLVTDIENENWFNKYMQEIAIVAKEKEIIVEVNTRGMYKGYTSEPYPSYNLLKFMKENNNRICLNADAHSPTELLGEFKITILKLKAIGFKYLWVIKNGKWQAEKID